MFTPLPADRRIERPSYVWLAVALELFTALGAIPFGLMLLSDTSGGAVGSNAGWIESTIFGSYLVPGLYLLVRTGSGCSSSRCSRCSATDGRRG